MIDIKNYILNKGFGIEETAKKMGVTRQSLHHCFTHTDTTSVKYLKKIADAVGGDVSDFFKDTSGASGQKGNVKVDLFIKFEDVKTCPVKTIEELNEITAKLLSMAEKEAQ